MSREVDDLRRLLSELGYTLVRTSGPHHIYKREGFPMFTCPVTPSDWRAMKNDMAALKRRHPEHFTSNRRAPEDRLPRESSKSRQKRKASKVARNTGLALAASEQTRVERPDVTACAACGRRWLSRDITPQGRPCVECGGEYIIGNDLAALRTFVPWAPRINSR
jgi:predicted RNA binding protein YcfA (HicA-like mRNA interferase family)